MKASLKALTASSLLLFSLPLAAQQGTTAAGFFTKHLR